MASLPRLNNYGNDVRITTLYIRPLADKHQVQKLRRNDILNHFIEFGDVISVRLRNKPKRSYSFVKFTHPDSAVKALQTKIHTIAGGRVEIDVAYPRYQDRVSLLDLNNDCLSGIFFLECLSIHDLCSVAETCRRLKEIAGEVFRRKYKKCNFAAIFCNRDGRINARAKRILVNFGSMISELMINALYFEDKRTDILHSVARYCRYSLESLTLKYFNIPESLAAKLQPIFNNLQKLKMTRCAFKGAGKDLFADCHAMVELVVCYDHDTTFIHEQIFPKLQHFEYEPYGCSAQVDFESFLSRHQNLRVLNIWECDRGSSLLQSISANCRQLEQLQCNMAKDSTLDLSNLGCLKKLRINFAGQSVTKSSLGWNNLHFLAEIKLEYANVDSEFVRSLSQLKDLQILELRWATGIQNLQQIDDMNQLAILEICSDVNKNFDLVRLIQRLGNLKYLNVDMGHLGWEMDTKTYLQIVEVVGKRPNKSKLDFRYRYYGESLDHLAEIRVVSYQYRHLVEVEVLCN